MTAVGTSQRDVGVGRLSTLDRLLPVWIGLAMMVGLLAGRPVPGLGPTLDAVQVDGISLPIALGLLVMMYPVLAKVRYDRLDTHRGPRPYRTGVRVPRRAPLVPFQADYRSAGPS